MNHFVVLDLMKKTTSARGQVTPKSADEYLEGVPEPTRSTLNKVRTAIRSVAPSEAAEAISYGIPMFKYKGLLVALPHFRSIAVCSYEYGRNEDIPEGPQGLPDIQRCDSLSPGRASIRRSHEGASKGSARREGTQETALTSQLHGNFSSQTAVSPDGR